MDWPNKKFHVREYLKKYDIYKKNKDFPEPRVVIVTQEIQKKFLGISKTPEPFELEKFHQIFSDAIELNNWQNIPIKAWSFSPYLLWFNAENNLILANNSKFIAYFFHWLESTNSVGIWKKLIFVYLNHFNQHLENPNLYKSLAEKIYNKVLNSRPLHAWKERHEELKLFSIDFDLRDSLSKLINKFNGDWGKFADSYGFHGRCESSDYIENLASELLEELNNRPTNELLDCAINFIVKDDKLRFKQLRLKFIQSILSPWTLNYHSIDEQHREKVQNTLLSLFSDPRLPHIRHNNWRMVSQKHLSVIYQWLSRENIEQFFKVIDYFALENHWKYRKAFWKVYLDEGHIEQVCLAFGPDIKKYAEKSFGSNLLTSNLDENKSVMLIKIGNLVFSEWSHNGKCRAWHEDDENCPKFYELDYRSKHLKSKSLKIIPNNQLDGISHQHSESYSWQKKLAEFIYQNTGIRINYRDFYI